MTTRHDTHRPAVANPADYQFLTEFYQGTSDAAAQAYASANAAYAAFGRRYPTFTGNHAAKGTCDHCGTFFAYGVCYLHIPTGETIRVGYQCAAHAFDFNDRESMLRAKAERAQAAARERARIDALAAEFRAAHPALVAALEANAEQNGFYASLLANLARYGSLTDRQITAAERAVARDAERAVRDQALTATAPPAAPVLTGTVTITGTVQAVRTDETPYGPQRKMRVVDDRGFAVWGSVPNAIYAAKRGDRVTFTATVEASSDDPTFGFFKRPRRADLQPAA